MTYGVSRLVSSKAAQQITNRNISRVRQRNPSHSHFFPQSPNFSIAPPYTHTHLHTSRPRAIDRLRWHTHSVSLSLSLTSRTWPASSAPRSPPRSASASPSSCRIEQSCCVTGRRALLLLQYLIYYIHVYTTQRGGGRTICIHSRTHGREKGEYSCTCYVRTVDVYISSSRYERHCVYILYI